MSTVQFKRPPLHYDTSTLTLNDGAKITSTTLEGSGGTFLINTADEQVINITANNNKSTQAVLSGS